MKKPKTILLTLLLMIALTFDGYAQLSGQQRITDIDIRYYEDKIFVPYSIVNGRKTDRYIVWVQFYGEQNQLLDSRSLVGDFNEVTGNGSKLISWDPSADGIVLNESIYAKVNAKQIPQANAGKAFAYSTLYPGAGQYQYQHGKPYWIKGALAYSLIASAAGIYLMSNSAYDDYRYSDLPSVEDPSFQKSNQYKQTAFVLAGFGAGIWLLDYAGIISKSSKHRKATPESIKVSPDYRHYTAYTPAKHFNTRGLPPSLFAELRFIDDNSNGILEARESAELRVILSNQGSGDAMNLNVEVRSDIGDSSLRMEKLYNFTC